MTRARSFGLVWPYALAAACGYLLGAFALPGLSSRGASTPLSRVGFALRDARHASPTAWSALEADVQAVRSPLVSPEREVFDLVAAVRGLNNEGNSDFGLGEQICRSLAWPRCDQPALERLKELLRP